MASEKNHRSRILKFWVDIETQKMNKQKWKTPHISGKSVCMYKYISIYKNINTNIYIYINEWNDTTITTGFMYVRILFYQGVTKDEATHTPSNERVWGYNRCTDTPENQWLEPENRFIYQPFASWQVELLFPNHLFFKVSFLKLEKKTRISTSLAVAMQGKNPWPSCLRANLHNFADLGSCHQTWVMNVFLVWHQRMPNTVIVTVHTSTCFASLSVWRVVHKPSNCSCLENIRSVVDFPPS